MIRMSRRNTTPLRKLLFMRDMPVKELANILGYSVSNTYEIVSGKRPLRADEIIIICKVFNVTSDYLLGLEEE